MEKTFQLGTATFGLGTAAVHSLRERVRLTQLGCPIETGYATDEGSKKPFTNLKPRFENACSPGYESFGILFLLNFCDEPKKDGWPTSEFIQAHRQRETNWIVLHARSGRAQSPEMGRTNS